MADEAREFIDRLPTLPPADVERTTLELDGFVLRAGNGVLRVVVEGLCLDFSTGDIIDITELPEPDESSGALAVPVRLTLKRGAQLLDIAPAAMYTALVEKDARPFAYAVRDTFPPKRDSPRFDALEAAFRKEHGLT